MMEQFSSTSFSRRSSIRWRFFSIAALLFIGQVFAQLHSLEHLEEHDNDEHSGEICNLCILGSNLGDVDYHNNTLRNSPSYSVVYSEISYSYLSSSYNSTYPVRGPPLISSSI